MHALAIHTHAVYAFYMSKNKNAQMMAKKRWENTTEEERSDAGRKAAQVRWSKFKKVKKEKSL